LLFDSSTRGAFAIRDDEYGWYRMNCNRDPILLNEGFMSYPLALQIDHAHYDYIEEVVQLIGSSGLLQYYVKTMQWYRYYRNFIERQDSHLKVFSLEDLSFGFLPWLVAISISLISFLLELIWFLLTNSRKV
jgi:hypothetical protein